MRTISPPEGAIQQVLSTGRDLGERQADNFKIVARIERATTPTTTPTWAIAPERERIYTFTAGGFFRAGERGRMRLNCRKVT